MRDSLFLKITLFFIAIFIGAGYGFHFLSQKLDEDQNEKLEAYSGLMFSHLRRSIVYPAPMRKRFLEERGYGVLDPESLDPDHMSDAFSTVPSIYPIEIQDSIKEGKIRVLKDERHLYVYLTGATPPFLLQKKEALVRSLWPEAVFVSVLTSILILYLLIIRTLFPLHRIISTIRRYGHSGEYIPLNITGKDEIGLVSTALDVAMRKNRALMDARRLFLRNILHELKTPITVGKLALPFLKKGEEKEILQRAFLRMEQLIQEVVRVEQITSGALKPQLSTCGPAALVEQAKHLLFINDSKVSAQFDGTLIHADCDAMISVFKNLIDNALKYSTDDIVYIEQKGEQIAFINSGAPWEEGTTLEALSQPFRHHGSPEESFGLGLYIIKSILDSHGFEFTHRYAEGRHRFEILCRSPLLQSD